MRVANFILRSLAWSVLIWASLEIILLVICFVRGDLYIYQDLQRHIDMHRICIPLGGFLTLWIREGKL